MPSADMCIRRSRAVLFQVLRLFNGALSEDALAAHGEVTCLIIGMDQSVPIQLKSRIAQPSAQLLQTNNFCLTLKKRNDLPNPIAEGKRDSPAPALQIQQICGMIAL